jgi:hypothetical protein
MEVKKMNIIHGKTSGNAKIVFVLPLLRVAVSWRLTIEALKATCVLPYKRSYMGFV